MAGGNPGLTLILGGARSGKSHYAEQLASTLGDKVLYVATAEALDDEMRARVVSHQARRPAAWSTLEAPFGLGPALRASPEAAHADAILLDCLTLLVSNVLLSQGRETQALGVDEAWASVESELDALLEAHHRLDAHLIIVSNEVGLGIVPAYDLGRTYRDCLGWANQKLARRAEQVVLMVAGLPVDLNSLPLAWPDWGE